MSDVQTLVEEGIKLHQSNSLNEAEKKYHQVLELAPNHFTAHHMLGVIAAQKGEFKKAANWIESALVIHPRSPVAYFNLAGIYEALNADEKAIACLLSATSYEHQYYDAYVKCGHLYIKSANYKAAIEQFSAALAIRMDLIEVCHERGAAWLHLGDAQSALNDFEWVLQHQSNHVMALSNRGNALVKLNRLSEAIDSYYQAVAVAPEHPAIWSNLANALRQALKLQESKFAYQKAIELQPNVRDPDLLTNYGYVLAGLELYEEAVLQYRQALFIKPDHFEALNNMGLALSRLDQKKEAIDFYDKALAIDPHNDDVLYNRAYVLTELKKFAKAADLYATILQINPDYKNARVNLGHVLTELGKPEEGLSHLNLILEKESEHILALSYRAAAYIKLCRFEEALKDYDAILDINADLAVIYSNKGYIFHEKMQYEKAIDQYNRSLEIQQDQVSVLINRSNSFIALKRYDDALLDVNRVLLLDPENSAAYANQGLVFASKRKINKAIESYQKALSIKLDNLEALNNLANAYVDIKQFEKALDTFSQVINLDPHYAMAHWNESLCRLLLGDYLRGFEKYEWRWECKFLEPKRQLPKPLWDGVASLKGKTILLHAEQGLGDTLQFLRYVPLLVERGAKIILAVTQPIQALVKNWKGVIAVVERGDATPDYDYHCPLMSLAFVLKTELTSIPQNIPYIFSQPDQMQRWSRKLGQSRKPRVGVVWSGNPKNENNELRSVPLEFLAKVPAFKRVELVSLKREITMEERDFLEHNQIKHFEEDLVDFSETAALIEQLDWVISVDTSVAHLAGAMGKKLWVLLAYCADWRWLEQREDSPWYPTARLFRQHQEGDWKSVMKQIDTAIKHELNHE